VWENTGEAPPGGRAPASFGPTSAIPGVVFTGSVPPPGALRAYDAATGARRVRITLGDVAVASGAAVVDGIVVVGSGIGAHNFERIEDPSHQTSRIPENVTALCVRGTADCDADADGFDPPADCDDTRADVNPAATDVPDNAVDEDCDGLLARTADRCLAGGSAVRDGRDLAALRAALAVSCPCGGFVTRGAYRRCARAAIDAAVSVASLRRRCRSVARAQAGDSVCGRPGRTVCCETPASGASARCRIIPAARCVSHRHAGRADCAPATHCADTTCAVAAACRAPGGDSARTPPASPR
jgi:Putative metal-binding motif